MALSVALGRAAGDALEAIACGCPVVSTASSPGLVELLRTLARASRLRSTTRLDWPKRCAPRSTERFPSCRPAAVLPYGIDAACDEHAALFAGLMAA